MPVLLYFALRPRPAHLCGATVIAATPPGPAHRDRALRLRRRSRKPGAVSASAVNRPSEAARILGLGTGARKNHRQRWLTALRTRGVQSCPRRDSYLRQESRPLLGPFLYARLLLGAEQGINRHAKEIGDPQ